MVSLVGIIALSSRSHHREQFPNGKNINCWSCKFPLWLSKEDIHVYLYKYTHIYIYKFWGHFSAYICIYTCYVYGWGDRKVRAVFSLWTNDALSKSGMHAKTEAGKLKSVFKYECIYAWTCYVCENGTCLCGSGDSKYGSQIVGSLISACTNIFCCCSLLCLWTLNLLFKLLFATNLQFQWVLHTVHLSKVSKVLFFSICLRWLELAGRSSRDPCQILMSSVLAFDPVSPLFPGWLLSNSITFSLRQQEIVCYYSRYPSVKANVQSSAQVPVPSEKTIAVLV